MIEVFVPTMYRVLRFEFATEPDAIEFATERGGRVYVDHVKVFDGKE